MPASLASLLDHSSAFAVSPMIGVLKKGDEKGRRCVSEDG